MTFPPPGDVFVFMIFPSSRSHQYTYRARVFFPGPRSYAERRETRVSKRIIIIITINEPRTHLVWGGRLVCVPPLTRAICRVRKSMCIIWELFWVDDVPERVTRPQIPDREITSGKIPPGYVVENRTIILW